MSQDFLNLTNNKTQKDALKQIAQGNGVNGGKVILDGIRGSNYSINSFVGDLENFQKVGIGSYNDAQLESIFGAIDVNGDGTLSEEEVNTLATMGTGVKYDYNVDYSKIIDSTDIKALYETALDCVDKGLIELDKPKTTTSQTTTTNTTPTTNNSSNITTSTTNTVASDIKVNSSSTSSSVKTGDSLETSGLADSAALAAAQELRTAMKGNGTDEATVNRILTASGYSSADIVKIMDAYEKEYGGTLINDIQNDFSWASNEGVLREALYNAVLEESFKQVGWSSVEDIPKDTYQKASKFYSDFKKNSIPTMKEFDKLSEKDKTELIIAAELMFGQAEGSMIKMITDANYWEGGAQDKYVRNLISSMKNTAIKNKNYNYHQQKESSVSKDYKAVDTKTTNDINYTSYATQLRVAMQNVGTDEDVVNNIILNGGLSSGDLVELMKVYQDMYGEPLIKTIQGDFSCDAETQLREKLYNAAETEALNKLGWSKIDDIPSDIVNKANKFYDEITPFGSGGGYVKNTFYKMSDEERAQVLLACKILHPEKSPVRMITDKTWGGFSGVNEDELIRTMFGSMISQTPKF